MAMKPLPLIILILVVIGATAAAVWFAMRPTPPAPVAPEVSSFDECVVAGYPVQESHPRRCATPDGRVFAEELPAPEPVYQNASADYIRVELPTPGAVTGKEFTIRGEARGSWFFEASFPIEILDQSGEVITTVLGTPRDGAEWMTSQFVPFSAQVSLPSTYMGPATIVLIRDNASGLPEHDRSMAFPITVEY